MSNYTQSQAEALHAEWGVALDPWEVAPPEPAPVVVPQYDIAKIRRAYNRVLTALTQAKAEGDAERVAKYRADYVALKDLLAKANEEQRTQMADEVAELRKQLATATEQLQAARKTIGDLRYEVRCLREENRDLRSPTPAHVYRAASTITQGNQPTVPPEFWGGLFDELKPSTPRKAPANSEENT